MKIKCIVENFKKIKNQKKKKSNEQTNKKRTRNDWQIKDMN